MGNIFPTFSVEKAVERDKGKKGKISKKRKKTKKKASKKGKKKKDKDLTPDRTTEVRFPGIFINFCFATLLNIQLKPSKLVGFLSRPDIKA